MGRFMEDPSEAFEQAVGALCDLLEAEGPESVLRAYAEVMEEAASKAFCEHWQVEQAPGSTDCTARLFGKRHRDPDTPAGPSCRYCHPPGSDHAKLYVRDGEGAVFLSQPYELGWEEMQELVEWCRERGLRADVSARESWYFPGWTVAVRILTPEALRGSWQARRGEKHGAAAPGTPQ